MRLLIRYLIHHLSEAVLHLLIRQDIMWRLQTIFS